MNKRTEGARFETAAARYLEEQGYRILERNFRCSSAEIDLVARDGKYLVFIEVKERASSARGIGAEAVDLRKQKRICQAARFYLRRYRIDPSVPVRFDVVSVDSGKIRLYRNAFLFKG